MKTMGTQEKTWNGKGLSKQEGSKIQKSVKEMINRLAFIKITNSHMARNLTKSEDD